MGDATERDTPRLRPELPACLLDAMKIALHIVQIIIALGILNVWLLRFGKQSEWRGGDSRNMTEEFKAYGLPSWFMFTVGAAKVALACLLIASVWFPMLKNPAAIGLALLMVGAVMMHLKVKDPIKKSVPAMSALFLCVVVAAL